MFVYKYVRCQAGIIIEISIRVFISAPAGKRFEVFASTPFQRFYHSSALLIPDGRVAVLGTDQFTFMRDTPGAYSHVVEGFTPPWLLDGTERPVITR